MARKRQEVINVILAQLLRDRGVVSAPETIMKADGKRNMPDVIVDYNGLRTVIECEIADAKKAEEKAIALAERRVVSGIAQIGLAVVYPEFLRTAPFGEQKEQLSNATIKIAVVTEGESTAYVTGKVDTIEQLLRRAFEELIKEDVVSQAVELLDTAVEWFAIMGLMRSRGSRGRVARALGVDRLVADESKQAVPLTEARMESICRISALVLINALIFQAVLTNEDDRVESLQNLNTLREFAHHWQFIIDEINYFPIFSLATSIIKQLAVNPDILSGFQKLIACAESIVGKRAALRHDLMGRVYHRLLADQKYLGTYYTTIPSATLLCKLALNNSDVDWSNLDEVGELAVADLSCGTGTLLMATADAIKDNYVAEAAAVTAEIDLNKLHTLLAETILHGYDVLPSAIHLTASTLALRSPTTVFHNMNLFSIPLGGPGHSLGSIEFLKEPSIGMTKDLFGSVASTEGISGTGAKQDIHVTLPKLDACIINPPFTRSVGGNLLFGSVPESQRKQMQKKLAKWMRGVPNTPKVLANTTAGLGSVFILIANQYLKDDGVLAFVLPKTVLTGSAWENTRALIRQNFEIDYIIVSYDSEQWNFSESTSLSEVLFVGTKRKEPDAQSTVVGVNLWRNPRTSFEALAVFRQLKNGHIPSLSQQGSLELEIGDEKFGEAVSMSLDDVAGARNFLLPVTFAQADLTRTAHNLQSGKLWLPTRGDVDVEIPLVKLEDYFEIGPDRRDIYDGFSKSKSKTSYPAVWGRDKTVNQMAQEPKTYLSPLSEPRNGRSLRNANLLWSRSGRLIVTERIRLDTQGLSAALCPRNVLSNVWWTLFEKDDDLEFNDDQLASLVMWFNSTLGWISLLTNRDETEGAWIGFKKPGLYALNILDVLSMDTEKLGRLADAYDALATQPLLPLKHATTDPTRIKIDEAICRTLHLPDLQILREIVAREPIIANDRL